MAKGKSVLNPTVVRLGLVSLFADISSEMLYPITPLFLTMTLGASMTSVGLIEGLAEGLSSVLKTYAGVWSDRIGKRKPFVWAGYLLASFAKPLIALASTWGFVLFARSLDRVGKGLRTAPRDALLAESVDPKQRGAAFGWHRAMDTLGAVIGPLFALVYLKYQPANLRPIFLWAFIPGILAAVIASGVSDIPAEARHAELSSTRWNWKNMPSGFKVYVLGWAVFSLTNSSDVFLLLRVKERGAGMTSVILLYCLYNLTYAVASPYLGKLSDIIGRKKCLLFGLLLFALVYLGFSFATQPLHFAGLFAVYGIYMAATDGVGKALAIDFVDDSKKASALGALGTFTGVSTLVASIVAGALWDKISPQATFLYGVLGSVIAFLLFSMFLREVDSDVSLA